MFTSDYFPTYPVGPEAPDGGGGSGGLTAEEVDLRIWAFKKSYVDPIQTQVTQMETDLDTFRNQNDAAHTLLNGNIQALGSELRPKVTQNTNDLSTLRGEFNGLVGSNASQHAYLEEYIGTIAQQTTPDLIALKEAVFGKTTYPQAPGLLEKYDGTVAELSTVQTQVATLETNKIARSEVQPSIYLPSSGTPGTEEYDDHLLLVQGQGMALVSSVGATQFAPKSLVTTVTNLDTTVQDHLTNHPDASATDLATVSRKIQTELSAYHMGTPMRMSLPHVQCTGLWVITDETVDPYQWMGESLGVRPTPGDAHYIEANMNPPPPNDWSVPYLLWQEYWKRKRGKDVAMNEDEFYGYGYHSAIGGPRCKLVTPTWKIPRGIHLAAGRLALGRTMGPTSSFLICMTADQPGNTNGKPMGDWTVRIGLGTMCFMDNSNQPAGPRTALFRYSGTSGADTGIYATHLFPLGTAADPWDDVVFWGVSVDTVQNKLCMVGQIGVCECVGTTAASYTHTRTGGSAGTITLTPNPSATSLPTKINFTEWQAGTFVGNDGTTRELGSDTIPWNPNGTNQWFVKLGSLEGNDLTHHGNMIIHEVRTYDTYLDRNALVHEAYHIKDTTMRRCNPPMLT